MFHGELTWRSLEGLSSRFCRMGGQRRYAVYEGQIERSTANRLLAVLTKDDPGQRVYFVYNHPGCLIATPNHEPLAFVGGPGDFDVVIKAAAAGGPTYIWPGDRRWLVATDYDLPSTYIACDVPTSEALTADDILEVLPVSRLIHASTGGADPAAKSDGIPRGLRTTAFGGKLRRCPLPPSCRSATLQPAIWGTPK